MAHAARPLPAHGLVAKPVARARVPVRVCWSRAGEWAAAVAGIRATEVQVHGLVAEGVDEDHAPDLGRDALEERAGCGCGCGGAAEGWGERPPVRGYCWHFDGASM